MRRTHDRSSASPDRSSRCDVLSDVLRSVQLTGAMLFLVEATTPWMSWAPDTEAFRRVVLPRSQHIVSYHVLIRGACWAGLRDGTPERFEAGDVLVIPHGDAYFLCDPPDAERTYGPRDAVVFFEQMAAGRLPTLVSTGGGGDRGAQFICGFLGCDTRPFNPALAALPRLLHMRAVSRPGDRMHHLLEFAAAELRSAGPGAQNVLVRLAELMFVEIARRHLAEASATQTGWLAGLRDPVVGAALTAMHAAPERRWTLPTLATACGASRSVLTARFTAVVGMPPMTYLARWRMQLASRMLRGPDVKVLAVAHAVGYDAEAAFSRQFKRLVGVSPLEWRRASTP